MEKRRKSWEISFLKWFLSFLFLSLVINIGVLVLIHEEPRRGIITFEMLKSHNFLQPTVLGIPYFKKPPLHEWVTSLLSLLSGSVSEFSLRVPSAISVVLTSLVIFLTVKEFWGKRLALFSSLIYPTFYIVLIGYGSKCEPDTLFTLFVTLAVFSWFLLFERGKELLGWFFGYLFTSLALLTKGLPAIHFFYFFVLSYLFLSRKLERLFTINHLVGGLVGVSPFLLWLSAVETKQAVATLFSEVLSRAPGEVPFSKTIRNFVTYPLRFIAATFPWSVLFIYYAFKRREIQLPEDLRLRAFSVAFLLDFLLYWVFPGSRLRYVMPALPLLALVLGYYLLEHQLLHKRAKEIVRFTAELIVPVAIVVGVIVTKNPSLILKSTVEFLIFLYAVYFLFLPRFNFTYSVVLFSVLMLIFRGFYSSYYYPIAQFKYPPVREVASSIVRDSKGYPLYTKTTYLQLCFYVERGRNEVLHFSRKPPRDSLFLSESPEGHVLRVYTLGKHKFFLCSYGVISLKDQSVSEAQKRHSHEKQNHSKEKGGSPGG